MKIQDIVTDVRSRVESAGKQYQGVFKAYVDAQRKALSVVTRNGQTLANTEIGAAKNVFAAARASFDKARTDGVRQIANNPQAYVPNGRDQIVSAYKDTINLLVRTTNELTDVVSNGYKSVREQLTGSGATATTQSASKTTAKSSTGRKKTAGSTTANKSASSSSAAGKNTAKRKTAATRKSTATKSAATGSAKSASGTRKRSTTAKKSTASTPSTNGSAGNGAS